MAASESYLGCSKKAHIVPRSNRKLGKGKFRLNSQKKLLAGPPVLCGATSRMAGGMPFLAAGLELDSCLSMYDVYLHALLWPWTENVKSPTEGQGWNCTQHRYPSSWAFARLQHSASEKRAKEATCTW